MYNLLLGETNKIFLSLHYLYCRYFLNFLWNSNIFDVYSSSGAVSMVNSSSGLLGTAFLLLDISCILLVRQVSQITSVSGDAEKNGVQETSTQKYITCAIICWVNSTSFVIMPFFFFFFFSFLLALMPKRFLRIFSAFFCCRSLRYA